MPLSRSPRMDRRRRAIRENLNIHVDGSDDARVSPSRTSRSTELPDMPKRERGVAYSHSVRRACQHRLVQFIPVRKLSLTGAVLTSLAIPLTLVALHYLVFVSGTLDWAGHPMSALLNANSPRSMAAWLSSHLWLLCLAATVLTFRLRKHKLDDYEGEYRLWFWLVFTCVVGSIDSTTRLTELFGSALDRWSQVHVGWSGGAIVQATLATLIGLLGLRLCSELKAVPASLVLWLIGLVMWAGSAALSQSLLRLDMSAPVRAWLRASLWLGGLTSIWLCGLFYLRATFMEAQRRFLDRALTGSQATPWRERLRQSLPALPTMPGLSRFGWSRGQASELSDEPIAPRRKKAPQTPSVSQRDRDEQLTATADRAADQGSDHSDSPRTEQKKRRWGFGLGSLTLQPPVSDTGEPATDQRRQLSSKDSASQARDSQRNDPSRVDASRTDASRVDQRQDQEAELQREYGKRPSWFRRSSKAENPDGAAASASQVERDRSEQGKPTLRERFSWQRKPRAEAAAGNAAKENARTKAAARTNVQDSAADSEETAGKKSGWLRLPKPKLPKLSLPKPKLPKLKLPSFRLPPPGESNASSSDGEVPHGDAGRRVPSVQGRPLPGTSRPSQPVAPANDHDDDDADNVRGLSKAERKRLKRMHREEGDRRAA